MKLASGGKGRQQASYRLQPRRGSRMEALMAGRITIDDLTQEELETGILNDANGERSGRINNLVPREFHTAVVRRLIEIGEGKMKSAYLEAAEQIIEIALGDPEKLEQREFDNGKLVATESRSYDPVVLKAAQYVFERIGGKTPDVVSAVVEVKPWEEDMEAFAKEFVAGPNMSRVAPEVAGDTPSSGTKGNGASN